MMTTEQMADRVLAHLEEDNPTRIGRTVLLALCEMALAARHPSLEATHPIRCKRRLVGGKHMTVCECGLSRLQHQIARLVELGLLEE